MIFHFLHKIRFKLIVAKNVTLQQKRGQNSNMAQPVLQKVVKKKSHKNCVMKLMDDLFLVNF